jgi:hypothetical protein
MKPIQMEIPHAFAYYLLSHYTRIVAMVLVHETGALEKTETAETLFVAPNG